MTTHVAWTLLAPAGDPNRERVVGELQRVCCELLNLCAGSACGCVTGREGDERCSEGRLGGSYPLTWSAGPDWVLTAVELPGSVRVDWHYGGPQVATELAELSAWLLSQGLPVVPAGMAELP